MAKVVHLFIHSVWPTSAPLFCGWISPHTAYQTGFLSALLLVLLTWMLVSRIRTLATITDKQTSPHATDPVTAPKDFKPFNNSKLIQAPAIENVLQQRRLSLFTLPVYGDAKVVCKKMQPLIA